MSKLSNVELLGILSVREDYQEEAIEAAELELQKRNLSEEDISKLQDEISAWKKSVEPLPLTPLLIYLSLSFLALLWQHPDQFREEGYSKRYKTSWLYMKLGLTLYISLLALFVLFKTGQIG